MTRVMKFLAANPFVRLVLPFAGGLLLQHYLKPGWFFLILPAGLALLVIILPQLLSVRRQYFLRRYGGAALLLLLAISGSILMKQRQQSAVFFEGRECIFTAEVSSIPEEKTRTWQTELRLKQLSCQKIKEKGMSRKIKLLAYFQKYDSLPPVKPGDVIAAHGYIEPIRNRGNPSEFDYQRYMATRSIYNQVYLDDEHWWRMEKRSGSSVVAASNMLRQRLIKHLNALTHQKEERAIAASLLLGYRGLLSQDMKSRFSLSGASHILAVSGLHVGIIYLIFSYLLVFMDQSPQTRVLKTLLITAILAAYAFLTGLSPSVCRATLMFSVLAAGKYLNRNSPVYNSLAFSAFILLVINPMLIFSVSFQLSYMAVISIAFFQPRLYRLIEWPRLPDRLWQWFTLALAAQIGASPLIIYYFHIFPNYFWLSNFIVIPAASMIILLGFLYLSLQAVFPILAGFISAPLTFTIRLLTGSTRIIGELPLSASEDLYIDLSGLITIYLVIIFVTAFLTCRKAGFLKVALFLVLFGLVVQTGVRVGFQRQKELLVCNIPGTTAIHYRNGPSNVIYISDPGKTYEITDRYLKKYFLSRGLSEPSVVVLQGRNGHRNVHRKGGGSTMGHFMEAGGLRLACLNGSVDFSRLNAPEKLELDYIILGGNKQVDPDDILRLFRFRAVVIDPTSSYYLRQKWIKRFRSKGVEVHSIPEQGAFRVEMHQKFCKKIGLL